MGKLLFLTFLVIFCREAVAQAISAKLMKNPGDSAIEVSGFVNLTLSDRDQEAFYEGGYLPDGVVGVRDGSYNRYHKRNSAALDMEIYLKAGRVADSGVLYGAVAEVESDSTSDGFNEGVRFDKAFAFAQGGFGKFEGGNNNAANQKMKVGPASFARATGGIAGKYLNYVNLPMLAHSTLSGGVCSGGVAVKNDGLPEDNANLATACTNVKLPRFILVPQAPIAHGGGAKGFYAKTVDNNYETGNNGNGDGYGGANFATKGNPLYGYKNGSFQQMDDATKLSFYTPRIDGFQLGLSFVPDSSDQGVTTGVAGGHKGVRNVVSWGLNYVDFWDNLGFAFSVTGEHGAFDKTYLPGEVARNRLDAYDFGAIFTYFGFIFGGSYGYWGDSLDPKSGIYSCQYDETSGLAAQNCESGGEKFDGASYYSLGLAYEFGPLAASLTHFASEFQENGYQATSFGVDYRLHRGVMPYFEVTSFEFNSNQPKYSGLAVRNTQLRDNKGYVGLVGVLLSF